MEKRKSFIFYRSFSEALKKCPDDVQLQLFWAIVDYALDFKKPEKLEGLAEIMFTLIEPQIEANNKRFIDGIRGGRPQKEDDIKTSGSSKQKPVVTSKQKPNNNVDNNVDNKENSKKEKFIDEIYNLYPSKCPVRDISTGKCKKDKDRIEKLLHTYSREEIKLVVKKEIEDKLGKFPLKNFSTFLNNFPDPEEIKQELQYPKSVEDVKDDDIKPTFPLFMDWIDEAGKNILAVNRKGFPTDIKQFNRMISVTIGGARTLAYVTLVLNRDGLGEYGDERGFMWTYLNYIKKHELYKG